MLVRNTKLSVDTSARMLLPAFSAGLDQAAMREAIGLTAALGFIPKAFPVRDILAPGLAWPPKPNP